MNVSKALTLSQKFSESQRIPELSSATMVALFQPISRYYKVISPKLSLDTLGVPSDLTLQFGHIG